MLYNTLGYIFKDFLNIIFKIINCIYVIPIPSPPSTLHMPPQLPIKCMASFSLIIIFIYTYTYMRIQRVSLPSLFSVTILCVCVLELTTWYQITN